ncbi:hypothetical protein CVT26_005814 [Gymnopilus dilepis]|uniref:Uncharacterized protein n=1 Tax=Gymnopilus dilepis TaxID=231916 RepID=A0A409WG23_9AGAR|nr:hypothetical protein CVT26_005814 [Gymnopilus dilepis]
MTTEVQPREASAHLHRVTSHNLISPSIRMRYERIPAPCLLLMVSRVQQICPTDFRTLLVYAPADLGPISNYES